MEGETLVADLFDYFNIATAVTFLPASGHMISNGDAVGAAVFAAGGLLNLFVYIHDLHTEICDQRDTIASLREAEDEDDGSVDPVPVFQFARHSGEVELEVQNQ